MKRLVVNFVLPLAFFAGVPVFAGQYSAERRAEILGEGLAAFERGAAAQTHNPAEAEDAYRQAAADFQALIDDGVVNAGLEYNLGNTWFRLDEPGRAVLHYRRAERLAPRDADIAANLEFVRGRVEPLIDDSESGRLWRGLFFWHYQTTLAGRLWFAAAASALGWGCLLVRLRWRQAPVFATGLLLISLGAASGISLLVQMREEAAEPHAVIVSGEQILRHGRGESYDPVLTQPLGRGVELRILDEQGDWLQVRLRDGRTGWVGSAGIERV